MASALLAMLNGNNNFERQLLKSIAMRESRVGLMLVKRMNQC